MSTKKICFCVELRMTEFSISSLQALTFFILIFFLQQPDLSKIELPWPQRKFEGYYKISRHYKWALNQVFHTFNYSAVIIIEG